MSHRSLLILAAGIAAVGVTTAADAQASAQARPAPVVPKPIARAEIVQQINASYRAVDTSGDGAITAPEIAAAQTKANQAAAAQFAKRVDETFRALDTNKDGQLSLAEFKAGSPFPQRQPIDPARVVSELDSNKDQKVSLTEFGANTLANFDRVDSNHDGVVTPAEAQAARAARR